MKHLLIVEDDPDHRLILRTILEAEGYQCEEAMDGQSALSILITDQVDLVLTDLNMPRMNGLQLIDEMKNFPFTQNTPVILLTSQVMEDLPGKAYTHCAQAVLSKPFDFTKLLTEVRSLIGKPELSTLSTMA